MTIFDCSSDPAGYSYQAIIRTGLAAAPKLTVTSSLRDIPQPYHGWGQAADFSNGDDRGSAEMDAFAAYLADTYGPYSLEIIHVNRDGSTVEWKLGQRKPKGWYDLDGSNTLAQHRNHAHWAITNAGLAAYTEGEAMTPEDRAYLDGKFKEVDDKIDQAQKIFMFAPDNNAMHLVSLTTLNKKLDSVLGWIKGQKK